MSAHLDLDDVAAQSPIAMRELQELRAENDRLRDAMFRIAATAERCIGESVSEIEDGLVRIITMCELKPNAKHEPAPD